MLERLSFLEVERLVLEATGRLERGLVMACNARQLPLAVVNPRQIRDFARATGQLAKTDELDALDVREDIEALLQTLKERLQKTDNKISSRMASTEEWNSKAKILRTVPGIGDVTVMTVLTSLPELGQLNRRKIGPWSAKKVALVACMRKMLTILNAMLKTHTQWSQLKEVSGH